jgi:ParB family transcriptional regulator, chromosome partitioning protein
MSNRSAVPKMRGVEAFLSDTSKIDRLESIAINSPSQYVDPRLLVRSPYQPRSYFLPQEMDELEASINRAGGVKVPLIVRPEINEIIAGERRSIIAIKRGDPLVPVFWHTCTDDEAAELAGFENVKRADLNAIDETNLVINMVKMRLKLISRQAAIDLIQRVGYQHRINGSDSRNNVVTADEIAMVETTIEDFTKGSLSLTSFCSHKLKLLNLPDDVLEAIRTDRIEHTKAAEIGKISDEVVRNELLSRAVSEGLSVTQVKAEVAKTKRQKASKLSDGLDSRHELDTPKRVECNRYSDPRRIELVEDRIVNSDYALASIQKPSTEVTQTVGLLQSQQGISQPLSVPLDDALEIDEKIEEMTETIRFKIANDSYALSIKQEIQCLLDRVMKLLDLSVPTVDNKM